MRLFFLLALISLLTPALGLSQSLSIYEDWRWTTFPGTNNRSITEGSDGTVWAVSNGGLRWFDGYQWHPIAVGSNVPPDSIYVRAGSSTIPGILVVVHDTLYKCSTDTTVALYSPAHEAVPLPGGAILIHTDSSLISYDHGSILQFPVPPGRITDRPRAQDLFHTRNGSVWMNRAGGLYKLEGGVWKLFLASPQRSLTINVIAEDSTGRGFLSISSPTALRGLWTWLASNAGATPVVMQHDEGDRIASIDLLSRDGAYALSVSGNLYRWNAGAPGRTSWTLISPLPSAMRHTNAIALRANGDLWAATDDGIALFNAHSRWWSFHEQPTPNHNRVHEIFIRHNGDIWMGTADGLVIEDRSGKSRLLTSINGAPIPDVTGVAEDTTGTMWISSGSAFEGAYSMDSRDTWRHVAIGSASEPGRFHRIRRDNDGNLWFLGIPISAQERGSGPGVYQYDYNTFHHIGRREGLPSGYVYAFTAGSDGSLWFGTSIGLSCRKNGKWLAWRGGTEIPLRNVFALAMDQKGDLWMADRGHGIVRLDQSGGIKQFTQKDGLSDDRVWDITVDTRGDIWAATANGLNRFHDSIWMTYGEATGLRTPALWPVLVAGDTVYAGTLGSGLGILDLRNCSSPPARIVASELVDENDVQSIRWNAFAWWGMPQSANLLTRFRIDNGEWSAWSAGRSADISDISSGDHKATIQAKNLFGEYNREGTTIAFSIPQPLFLQPIFIGAVIGLGAFVAILIRRRRKT